VDGLKQAYTWGVGFAAGYLTVSLVVALLAAALNRSSGQTAAPMIIHPQVIPPLRRW